MKSAYLYLLFFSVAIAKLTINQPKYLAESFQAQNASIPFGLANFGHIPWGKKLSGVILLPDPIDACKTITAPKQQHSTFFYIVERGNCDFTVKVYNAQMSGASFVIIVDNQDEVTENIIMADDGLGFKDHIPAVFIGKQDGQQIIKYLQQQATLSQKDKGQDVLATVTFDTIMRDQTTVDFGLSITNRESFRLIRNFRHMFKPLMEAGVRFNVYYDLFPCPGCIQNNALVNDCLGAGSYCEFDPAGYKSEESGTGQDLLYEILRQVCIFRNDPKHWMKYMRLFDSECLHPISFADCSQQIIQKEGIDPGKVKACVDSSFNQSSNVTKVYQQNYILDDQARFKVSSGLFFYPGVLVNNKTYMGELEAEDVFEDICNSMTHPPEACKDYVTNYAGPVSEEKSTMVAILQVLLVVALVLVLFYVVFTLYNRQVRKELNAESSQQVNQMVSNYIQFYEQRDHTKKTEEQV